MTDLVLQAASKEGEELFANSRLNEHYQYVDCIGAGGMGFVFKAKHRFLDRLVAIKTLHRFQDSSNAVMRFQREAQSIANLSHSGIVKVDDFGVLEDGRPFMVLEFVEGQTLADLINRNEEINLNRLVSIFIQIAEAVGHAHSKHILHRDLKPSNVLLTKNISGNEIAKVVDFGIAKVEEIQSITRTGEVCGSPPYMSPEQVTRRPMDERSDIYSLGCLMYECLAGRPPHLGTTALSTLCMHVSTAPEHLSCVAPRRLPSDLTAVVMKALEKEPHRRFEGMSDLADALKSMVGRRYRILPSRSNKFHTSFAVVAATASLALFPASLLIIDILGSFQPLAKVSDPDKRAMVMDVVFTNKPCKAARQVQEFIFGFPIPH